MRGATYEIRLVKFVSLFSYTAENILSDSHFGFERYNCGIILFLSDNPLEKVQKVKMKTIQNKKLSPLLLSKHHFCGQEHNSIESTLSRHLGT